VQEFKDREIKKNEKVVENDRKKRKRDNKKSKVAERIEGRKNARKKKQTK
jgi:hypothetical protein